MPVLTLRYRLHHVLDAIDRIRRRMAGVTFEAYQGDGDLQWMIERGVLIISEAIRHIPPERADRNPEIPWHQIKAIGNKLRHEYQWIDAYLMWTIATKHVQELRPVIVEMLAEIQAP